MSEALQFLVDAAGKRTAVVLPITDYEKLLEDLHDLAVMAERRDEPAIPDEQFKAELKPDRIPWPTLSDSRQTDEPSPHSA